MYNHKYHDKNNNNKYIYIYNIYMMLSVDGIFICISG